MKVFVLRGVLCDYTCGCIVVAAKNREEAVDIIMKKRDGRLYSDGLAWDQVENALEEVGKGYYCEVYGGS